jgi:23S rRNA (adenine1618-N6)-methyltransferase
MNQNTEKKGLHSRNKHRFGYDFAALAVAFPPLKPFVSINKQGNESIDFANPKAVKALNQALLKHDYGVENWDIPATYLCPPIPGRAEYIHHIADVLAARNYGNVPIGSQIRILDIGIGANCIYPIIGHREYGWQFVGSDIDTVSIKSAEKIVASNTVLQGAIGSRLQPSKSHILKNIIKADDFFDCTMCNPPFHTSLAEATKGTQRKLNNLGKAKQNKPVLNFGGQNAELWCEGGEIAFISTLISESKMFKSQCLWFSTLVSKQENMGKIYGLLKNAKVREVKTITMEIGNKLSRIVFWAF